ncbi:DUF2474 family protein [Polynucleobacter sp. JS-Safj-400b-B2]|nr:DUF2474 family protein [Polynucleobacter sp. JS-Safj-400b-B2]MBU3626970.1 DUF2474 family protein [Polynucleobacter sp. JS-Safj-400b-B2]
MIRKRLADNPILFKRIAWLFFIWAASVAGLGGLSLILRSILMH